MDGARVAVPRGSARSGTKSAKTRRRILDATATVLADKGYAGTRLSDVAVIAGVRAPAVYYYFRSREHLVEEVVTSGMVRNLDHVRDAIDALPASASGLERVSCAVEAHLHVVLRISDYTRAAIRTTPQLPPNLRERHVREQHRYAELWRDLLESADVAGEIAPGLDLRATRMLLLGALNWACEWWNPGRGSLRSVVTTAQAFVRNGIARHAGPELAPVPTLTQTPVVAEVTEERSTRDRILDATATVLNRHGYAGTRLADIGEVAGLQAPAIYYYFDSRDEVIQEVVQVGLRRTMDQVVSALAATPEQADPFARIAAAVRAHLEAVLTDTGYAAAAIRNAGQLPSDIRRVQLLDQQRYGAVWRTLLASATESGVLGPGLEPRAARMLVIGALNGTPDWWRQDRGTLAATIRTAQHLVCRGLSHPVAS